MYAFMYERAYLCARQWEQISIETRRQSVGGVMRCQWKEIYKAIYTSRHGMAKTNIKLAGCPKVFETHTLCSTLSVGFLCFDLKCDDWARERGSVAVGPLYEV